MTEEQGAQQSSDAKTDKKSFGKDVGKLVIGTIIAQIIGICLIPVITRIFGPELFGVAAVFTSITTLLLVISCMKYDQAIILPKDDADAGALCILCVIIVSVISAIVLLLFIFFGDVISSFLNSPLLEPYLILVPLFLFISGIYMMLGFWNTRKKRFGIQSVSMIVQTISGNGLKAGFGILELVNAGSLIIGQIIGTLASLFVLSIQVIRNDLHLFKNSFSLKSILSMAKKYKKFPLIETWSDLMQNLSLQLPVLMLTAFFSSTIVGYYSLGYTVLLIPLSLVGNSIAQVFRQRGAVVVRDNGLKPLVEDVALVMLLLTIIPMIILMTLGGDLFGIIFGSEWIESGVYLQILSIWAIVFFIMTPIESTFTIVEKQEWRVKANIINLIAQFSALIIGGTLQNIYLTIILLTVFGLISSGYRLWLIMSLSHASLYLIIGKSKSVLLLSFVILILLVVMRYVFSLNIFIIIAVASVITICYYLILYRSNGLIRSYIPF
ncbi:hypothetical protein SDC9_41143 [bioreactor metagenome]|uniref:Polysaccharide biosynthesis protein C-terminal domain-containing protein n=1 Tax=bioreactor metagenome TaxID=1076179 RepID=A0A644VUU0_9ZZZZ